MQIEGVELESLQYENIGSWPKTLRRMIIAGIVLITLLLGYWFDIDNMSTSLNAVITERAGLEQLFATTHHKAINLEEYRIQVNEVRQLLSLLTQQLPKTSEEANLLDDISQQASLSGLRFLSIKPSPEENKGFYISQPIEINLTGNYNGFGEFAADLSNLPRIVTLHNFTIKKGEESGAKLDISLWIRTYWTGGQG